MFKNRALNFVLAWAGAISLFMLFALVVQVGKSDANAGGDWVLLSEQNGGTADSNFGSGVNPLFIGNDNTPTLANYLVDVSNGSVMTAFVGVDAWGAAYDPVGDQVYHTDGDELYVWPVGAGSPNLLGAVTDPGGSAVTIHGLAFYNGTLYASSISTDIIYTVDPGSLVATPFITLVDTTASLSGIAIDPTDGTIYGTDDISNDGLVRVNPDGTLTLIAAYIGGETDVDGLAISDSREAYLITDDTTPPYFNVYDLNAMAYTTVVSNPWPTSAVQVSGAWLGAPIPPAQPGAVLTKTVGLDSNSCATADNVDIPAGGGGTNVTYCYTVVNTGTITLTQHLIVDDQLGTFGPDVFDIGPGQSAFMTVTALITQTTVNVATYTGYIDNTPSVTTTDSATVNVLPPTSVTLTGFGGDSPVSFALIWVASLLGVTIAIGYTIRRKRKA